ncbi:MAG: TldD/PmbA family protein, partial [Bdellovibrionales bacterium]|nr:TldD/PmbA family protein [Bdellovibrionales bacterium]
GLILRIFDGVSLFEEASHDFSEASALQLVSRLVSRVRDQQMDRGEEKPIQYWPPSWKQRLAAKLEPEIWEQIPRGVDAKTWVHFGTPQVHELWKANNEISAFTKENFNRLKDLGGEIGDENPAREPDFIQVKVNLDKSDYIFIDDETRMSQSLLRNSMSLVLMKKGERAFSVQGGLGGKESLEVDDLFIAEVYDKLRKCLVAEKIKPGRYKILMSPSITGVFAHEAFGHSQEGDTWARGRSKARELYESKERVGNDHATIYNNPAIYRNGDEIFPAWGSYYFDEEGWLAQEHCLVKKGVLQEPMTNLVSALRLGVPRTANGKREDWTHGLYVRQTNTYFSAGDKTLKELISMVDYGFLAHVAYGGMEDPKGMGIQVGMAFVEEIVNGQLTGNIFKGPNGGAIQMTGYVPEYLNSIIAKSKIEAHHGEVDESQHPWNEVGGCGKYHKEYVVAGCGGPYMLVDNV